MAHPSLGEHSQAHSLSSDLVQFVFEEQGAAHWPGDTCPDGAATIPRVRGRASVLRRDSPTCESPSPWTGFQPSSVRARGSSERRHAEEIIVPSGPNISPASSI